MVTGAGSVGRNQSHQPSVFHFHVKLIVIIAAGWPSSLENDEQTWLFDQIWGNLSVDSLRIYQKDSYSRNKGWKVAVLLSAL